MVLQQDGAVQLQAVGAHPREQRNIFSADSQAGQDLQRALFRWLATGEALGPSGEVEFSEEERRRLRALGYLQ